MTRIRLTCITLFQTLLLYPSAAQLEALIPAPPQINSRAHILLAHDSGRVISEYAADEVLPPASLTKIMTLYVVASELAQGKFTMEDQVTVSEKAWKTGGSRMFIEVGKKVSVADLIHGIVISSGNDASVALSEYVSGNEEVFADLMNRYARKLGMQNSAFTNSSGLPNEAHYSTARDLALLASALIRDHPKIYELHAMKEHTYKGIRQRNRNRLLWLDESVDGIKTGHTEEAGYCLVSSAQRDGMRLISVVMGAPGEEQRTRAGQSMLNYGFRFYETGILYRSTEPVRVEKVWKGRNEQVGIGLEGDLVLTWPRGAKQELQSIVILDEEQIIAPLAQGQRLGEIRIEYGGTVLAHRPLVALHEVAAGSIWRRVVDHIYLLWHTAIRSG